MDADWGFMGTTPEQDARDQQPPNGRRRFLRDIALGATAFTVARRIPDASASSYSDPFPFTITAPPAYVGNLQEWRASDGTLKAQVDQNGQFLRPATGPGHGPIAWSVGNSSFNGTPDPV